MKRGFTLLYSVLVTSLLLAIALSILNVTAKQIVISGVGRDSQIAFYSADSGIECIKYWDWQKTFATSTTDVKTIKCSDTYYDITPTIYPSSGSNPDNTGRTGDTNNHFLVGKVLDFCPYDTGNIRKCYKSTFPLYPVVSSDLSGPDVSIELYKNIDSGETTIRTYGHNTRQTAIRKVERALETRYTPKQGELCKYLDIVTVLDNSGSMKLYTDPDTGKTGFQLMKDAANAAVTALKSRPTVQLGLVKFAGPNTTETTLKSHLDDTESSLHSNINGLNGDGTATDLFDGLYLAHLELTGRTTPGGYLSQTLLANESSSPAESIVHDRNDTDYPDAMLLITDGEPNVSDYTGCNSPSNPGVRTLQGCAWNPTQQVADKIKADGIDLFVITVKNPASMINQTGLNLFKSIASPEHFFTAQFQDSPGFAGIGTLIKQMTSCN